ncbi:MAG: hypothetical protein Q7O66_07290 [Dehalococcoidia bacterium]|nr:hypothetical protein [Dehalococcoidia bacterium]
METEGRSNVTISYIGVHFSYVVDKGVTDAIDEADELGWKTYVREQNRLELAACYPVSYSFPCGFVGNYGTLDDVPMEDTPCPCGNPAHWLVKYSRR